MQVDCIEAGRGPLVVLVHSSVSGARQWRKLIEDLRPAFRVKAVNLYGYGRTPPWPGPHRQSLDDQAALVEAIIPHGADPVRLVGHSFGGSVAMKAALRLGDRVEKLALFEPNPFTLLRDNGRDGAFAEIDGLRQFMFACVERNAWDEAAEQFGDYWGGEGSWAAMPDDRRQAFIEALKSVPHEWESVLGERTPLATWAERLPKQTLVIYDPATRRPIREIVELLRGATPWRFAALAEGGHMAPLSRPDLVNPMIAGYLQESSA